MTEQRQVIHVYLKNRQETIMWVPEPEDRISDVSQLRQKMISNDELCLEDSDSFVLIDKNEIQAIEVVNHTDCVESAFFELAEVAIEHDYSLEEMIEKLRQGFELVNKTK